jgi:hypothetical protein
MWELTNNSPTMESECWLLETLDHADCAKEFFLFMEKREVITAKIMVELLVQTYGAAKVQESTKMKNSQDPKKTKVVAHVAAAVVAKLVPQQAAASATLLPTTWLHDGYPLWRCQCLNHSQLMRGAVGNSAEVYILLGGP